MTKRTGDFVMDDDRVEEVWNEDRMADAMKDAAPFYKCSHCGILYPNEQFDDHWKTDECERDAEHREMREKAFEQAAGALNEGGN